MVAIGNVKFGMRIEPIYVHELSREEVNNILKEQGIYLDTNTAYPIDTRLVNVFRTDRQKLAEYISLCKYAFDKKNVKNAKKPNAKELSIFDDDLQINYELKHMKESETMEDSEKVNIYRQARDTQSLFKMFGSNNVRLEMNILDRAYFEIQSLIQTIKSRRKTPTLPSGKQKAEDGKFREELFDKEAKERTEKVSEKWEEQIGDEEIVKEEYTKS